MKNILMSVFLIIIIFGCSKQPVKSNNSVSISEITFENIQPNNQVPNKIQYLFSLRDQDNHAVEIPNSDLNKVSINITENDQPVDNDESSVLIHNFDNFGIDVVLVLDFSASMENNDGISFMVDGAKSLINSLKTNHRIAIIEFHDNNDQSNFSIIQNFTIDKDSAISALDEFIDSGFYSGFSTCWDAVNLGLEQFSEDIEYETIRSIVFLSDGNDNSSLTTPDELITNALAKNVRIYNIGIGDISDDHQTILASISEQTGGKFYQNSTISFLQNEFDQIISDLGGNYVVSYITPQTLQFQVSISLTYKDITATSPITDTIDPSLISGDDKFGILNFSTANVHNDSISFYLNAVHIPRNVSELRFKIISDLNYLVENVNPEEGGLISDWTVPQKDEDGFWITQGNDIPFGDFGKLCKITFMKSRLDGFTAKFVLDNSVYDYGIKLSDGGTNDLDNEGYWRTELTYGYAIFNPQPKDFAIEQDSSVTLSWSTTNDSLNVKYAIYLDKNNPPQFVLIDSLAESSFQTIVDTASTYFWRVKAFTDNDEKLGNIWKFSTK